MGRGGRGFRTGEHVHPWLIPANVWQKPPRYCKVISFQLKLLNVKHFLKFFGKRVVIRCPAAGLAARWTPSKQIWSTTYGKAGFQSPETSTLLPSDSVPSSDAWVSLACT